MIIYYNLLLCVLIFILFFLYCLYSCTFSIFSFSIFHIFSCLGFEVLSIADSDPVNIGESEFLSIQNSLDAEVKAVVVGIDYSFSYRKLAIAGLYLQRGGMYVATNPGVWL